MTTTCLLNDRTTGKNMKITEKIFIRVSEPPNSINSALSQSMSKALMGMAFQPRMEMGLVQEVARMGFDVQPMSGMMGFGVEQAIIKMAQPSMPVMDFGISSGMPNMGFGNQQQPTMTVMGFGARQSMPGARFGAQPSMSMTGFRGQQPMPQMGFGIRPPLGRGSMGFRSQATPSAYQPPISSRASLFDISKYAGSGSGMHNKYESVDY